MASPNIPAKLRVSPGAMKSGAASPPGWRTIELCLRPLASLKLTVVLFAFAIALVFIGTLAQVEQGIWGVMKGYFRSWGILVPVQVLFPRSWFPNWQNIRGVFPFPGGILIGTLMALNLLAAHSVRFKLQARGRQLWSGLAVIGLGIGLTCLVIGGGQNQDGLQGAPPVSYATLWMIVEFSLAGIFSGVLVAAARVSPDRTLERVLLWTATAVQGIISILAFTLGDKLGDSSMRILWQLIQGGLSAVVLLGGCWLVFQKRAGIVLIHAGILLMMFGELLVGSYAVEEQMHIEEGQTKSFCQDIRSVELAIIDRSGAKADDVVAIPLTEKEMETRFVREPRIEVPFDNIPFHVSVIKFLHNSDVPRKLGAKEKSVATAGVGQNMFVKERSRHSGTDSEGTDLAAAYVKFTDKKNGEDLGTYLVSQYWSFQDLPEQLTVAGKTFDLLLRFRTNYKPYQVRLIDVRKDDYVGTDTPRNYSSDVQLIDAAKHVDHKTRIWMNNPLRYAGQTFYQSGYHKDPRTAVESTTLAVVTNTGWMIPYMACMIVATGLLAHFSLALIRFLKRRSGQVIVAEMVGELDAKTETIKPAPREDRVHPPKLLKSNPARPVVAVVADKTPSIFGTLVFPALVVVVMGGWLLSRAIPRREATETFDLRGFAALPVTFEGRVKPFDTIGRSSLRILSNRDYVEDAAGRRQPAIKWLLDVISHTEDAQKYRVFRIDNLDVQTTLGLKRRPGFRYAYSEFASHMAEFRKQVKQVHDAMEGKSDGETADKSSGKPEEKLDTFQKKILELDKKLQLFFKLSESHRLPDPTKEPFENGSLLVALADLGKELAQAPVPYAVPSKLSDRGWEPLTTAATRLWVQDMAKDNSRVTVAELAREMAVGLISPDRVEKMTDSRILSLIESMSLQRNPNMSDEEVATYARKVYQDMPSDMLENLTRTTRETILKEIPTIEARIQANIEQAMTSALGKAQLHDAPSPVARAMVTMLAAYKRGDADTFQRELAHYQQLLPDTGAPELNPRKTSFEAFFNAFAPFYHSLALYMVAFVLAALAWLGWSLPLNRAALWLVVFTFAVHSFTLVSRIYISGRPPVTNLYSSAIFIGWGCVVLGMVFEWLYRLGIGTIIASVAGFSTLLIAHLLNTEVSSHQGDTFTVMQAVLDTQFWLATHVVCITLGYSTTYLAGLLGVFYIVVGVLTPSLTKDHGKNLFRMIYGTLCFAIFFSFVGTVLGGLWADDSWGRFWGWDPKENGALIIVLWNALVLHTRWDGLVKERGLAVLAVVGNIVTSWSWFGVNELGIGLHSYGFTEGVLKVLGLFALSQLMLIFLGLLPKSLWWSTRHETSIA